MCLTTLGSSPSYLKGSERKLLPNSALTIEACGAFAPSSIRLTFASAHKRSVVFEEIPSLAPTLLFLLRLTSRVRLSLLGC